jgi:uncharacterized membrane protein
MTPRTRKLLLFAGLAGGGALFYARKHRRFAGIKLKRSIVIDRPPRDLYIFWRNFENLPRITELLESVKVLDDTRSRWTIRAPGSLPLQWDAEITTDRQDEMIGWRSSVNWLIETAGYARFEPLHGNRKTLVRVALEYYPPAGRIGAAFAAIFGKRPGTHIAEMLRRFKQLMEQGEFAGSPLACTGTSAVEGDDEAPYLVR